MKSRRTEALAAQPPVPEYLLAMKCMAARLWIFDQFRSYSPRLEAGFDTTMIRRAERVWKEMELRKV